MDKALTYPGLLSLADLFCKWVYLRLKVVQVMVMTFLRGLRDQVSSFED
jgi:hypothetical protein